MRRLLVLAFCSALVSCEEPPSREIANAEAQLENARKAGAERYAPDRFREARTALDAARQQVQRKNYRSARASAQSATATARAAAQGAVVARNLARGTADVARAEIQIALEEIDVVLQEAAAAKIPDAAFEELQPRLESARAGLERLNAILADGDGDALEARDAATALKSQVAELSPAFRAARTKWEEEHPKGRHRPRPAPANPRG